VCERIIEELKDKRAAIISQDCFYRPLIPSQIETVKDYNFDHPGTIGNTFALYLVLMCFGLFAFVSFAHRVRCDGFRADGGDPEEAVRGRLRQVP
jgi:hypothetical protein